jgi:F-type H+-transporting ATPase subunit epsilon
MDMTTSRLLECNVVTPEKAVLSETVDFVALPMIDGELGVLPGRAAMIGQLGYGELRIVKGKQVRRFFTEGGFAQVRDNVVTVLTARAIPAETINISVAEDALQAALIPALGPAAQETQRKNQEKARAQIRIARRLAEQTAAAH